MTKIFSIIFVFLSAVLNPNLSVHCKKVVPCYFIFGDSLVDNGNNNDRATIAKANYLPYGVDYPGGPTGRWNNGRNVADFIAEALGFLDHMPPFAKAGDAIVNGANYASGSAGILRATGKQFGDVISMDEQLQYHETSVNKISSALGNSSAAEKHLNQCLYSVGMGSNDYAAYTMNPARPTPDQYASQLIVEYSRQLRSLYKLGARKVAVFGLGTIGCVPASLRGMMYGEPCLSITRATSGVFNAKIKSLVDVLNKDLAGAKFTYIDVFQITVSDPAAATGFQFQNLPCCTVNEGGLCVPTSPVFRDTSKYEYFDGYHPTEAAFMAVAKRAFTAQSPSDAYPFDIKTLVHKA